MTARPPCNYIEDSTAQDWQRIAGEITRSTKALLDTVLNHLGLLVGCHFFTQIVHECNLRDRFEVSAHYARTRELCELFDSPALDPKAETLPRSELEPMLHRLMAQPVRKFHEIE